MRIKALVGFSGALTMRKGEIAECGDEAVLRDLLNAGYVTVIEQAESNSAAKSESGAKSKRGGKANESKRDNP